MSWIIIYLLFENANVAHHSDGIIEERLPEHEDVQQLINVDLLEHGQDGHGVHGRDDGAKQQAGQQVHVSQLGCINLTDSVHHPTDEKDVPQCPHHCKHQDGANVLGEGAHGQEVARIQDDRRQQVQEEQIGVKDGGLFSSRFDDATHQQSNKD